MCERAHAAFPQRRGAPATGADGLSPREREVLRLLAGGDTNGQIAATLGVSINTVERHVSNLYRKLDVRGRAEPPARDAIVSRWRQFLA